MFKVGDKVICISDMNTSLLSKGERYTISEIIDSQYTEQKYLALKELYKGDNRYRFGSKRFILDLKEIRKNKIIELCTKNSTSEIK